MMAQRQAQGASDPGSDPGFTLVEMLIVVVILGILAAVVSLGVATFRGQAAASCSAANLKMVNTAVTAYAARFPAANTPTVGQLVTTGYLQEPPGAC